MGAEAHVNACYKHYYYFVTKHSLVDKKELEPLVSDFVFSPELPKRSSVKEQTSRAVIPTLFAHRKSFKKESVMATDQNDQRTWDDDLVSISYCDITHQNLHLIMTTSFPVLTPTKIMKKP